MAKNVFLRMRCLAAVRITTSSFRQRRLIATAILLCSAGICFGDWPRTIACSVGRVHRDTREYAGGEEFCELLRPGSLVVKDGPYRFWFSEGHPGSAGAYNEGRQVGAWKECDRFGRCQKKMYDAVFPEERKRSTFKPEIPVSYVNGQYRFDFASCRSSWITKADSPNPIDLNILGGSPYRCEIAYIPQNVLEHGGEGDYFCRIPYSVGMRSFNSLDLIRELPLNGLPQFCHSIRPTGEPLIVQDSHGFPVASTVDVQSADMSAGSSVLELKFNKYAADLLMQAAERAGPLTTLLCFHRLTRAQITKDTNGARLFTYVLSSSAAVAKKEHACMLNAFAQEHKQ
ncbi:MAG: hypothetical protein JO051_16110 [Acidobacteriaceae bacterium]|nr:hypothetical protein [Acidobacteriaceae bacterium]